MTEARRLDTEHKGTVHDVAFNYYGDKMATCSSDMFVKVWDQKIDGSWILTGSWKAHDGPVWKVAWAPIDFGVILASCSFDRTTAIWHKKYHGPNDDDPTQENWTRIAKLTNSSTTVTDVRFAPKYLGLVLATCSADGTIHIYEALDPTDSFQWTLQHKMELKKPCSCLCWLPVVNSTKPNPMIVVGSDDKSNTTSSKVFICEYNKVNWAKTESVKSITHSVNDLIFAPNIGRSFHLLAVATNNVCILKLIHIENTFGGFEYSIEMVAQFHDHCSLVWRVSWNISGTLLASSGDDGCIRLWNSNANMWKCVGVQKRDENLSRIHQHDDLSQLTRFLKLGEITHPNVVHRH